MPRLGPDIRYRGHLSHSELRAFFSSAAVFITSPLWAEPFGLSVVEALASGTPVAAFANGALPEIVRADAGALAVDLTAVAPARSILKASMRSRRDAARSSERFSLDTMIEPRELVLRNVLARETAPRDCS